MRIIWLSLLLLCLTVTAWGEPDEGSRLESVGHPRELRGVWVASVKNMHFPKEQTLDAAAQSQQLIELLERMAEVRLNAIFFHVRPEGDALYASELEPWSVYLTGAQGRDPGYDPLELVVREAHRRNIEVHAWLNPYRAQAAGPGRPAPLHLAALHPEMVFNYAKLRWMDPSASEVRERLVAVCRDITRRYDVDGIHFDDYFYPYPENQLEFPDHANWRAYQVGGGQLSRADWRRSCVDQAIREVREAVLEEKPHVRFGISPFGLPAPGRPAGISGFDQYEKLYADTQKWMDEGWVDYLAPQLYWPTTQAAQAFEPLLRWWCEHSRGGRDIFAGNNIASLGSHAKWDLDEYRREVALTRRWATQGARGIIWWNIQPLLEDRHKVVDVFRNEFYPRPALTPVMARRQVGEVAPPSLERLSHSVQISHPEGSRLRAFTLYRKVASKWEIERIIPATETNVRVSSGQWAVAAVSIDGIESLGVPLDIP